MLFTLATNPVAPLMLVALVLAGLLLLSAIIYINFLNRRYPTKEDRRRLRRTEISTGKMLSGAALLFLVLGFAITSSVGDEITYAQNVDRVQAAAANENISLSEVQAKRLLGNEYGYVYKPIIAKEDGTVGSAVVKGRSVRLVQIENEQYILLVGEK